MYFAGTTAMGAVLYCAAQGLYNVDAWELAGLQSGYLVAFVVSCGPILLGLLLLWLTDDKMSARWPFHKENVLGCFGAHLLLGFMVTALPVYHIITSLLADPIYFSLWQS